jgi:TM2 domain-containing membrane protein YozV
MLCSQCGTELREQVPACPRCGHRSADAGAAADKRRTAGICGILLGELGVHKFVLGCRREGWIMLLVTVLTFGYGALIMWPIGLIEGIIYLTKSDEEFAHKYLANRRRWF